MSHVDLKRLHRICRDVPSIVYLIFNSMSQIKYVKTSKIIRAPHENEMNMSGRYSTAHTEIATMTSHASVFER